MIDLTAATRRNVAALFPAEEVEAAEALLAEECADNLPLLGVAATPEALERVRFAALRVSGGSLTRLREAVRIAKQDWRDVLVAAGFGSSVLAHESWQPRRLDRQTVDGWLAGVLPDGVQFRRSDRVEIRYGPRRGKTAVVIALAGLEPEPRYLVELEAGGEVEEYQRSLRVRQDGASGS
jgi:hypothetical protein